MQKFEAVPRVSGLCRFATAPLFDSPLNGFQACQTNSGASTNHDCSLSCHFFFENLPNKNESPYLVQIDELYP